MARRRSAIAATAAIWFAGLTGAIYINESAGVIAPCDSPIYCYGELLREIELARPFSDSKTFVDLPTVRPLDEVLEAFEKLSKPLSNNTELQDFLSTYFGEAGSEIEPVPTEELNTDPKFLEKVADDNISEFVAKVIDIWPDLTRRYVGSGNCTGCVDSFIPVNRTFVVAGGRFRESYYWDSFWIIEGLLRTQGAFTQIALNIIENFLDFVEDYGFVPNGARIYYLNRSQPPLLTQMVDTYIKYTNDTSILERALPLLVKEYEFFTTNRTISVEAGGKSYKLQHYEVNNNQPRPESFREDYVTANNGSYYAMSGIIYPEVKKLSDEEKALLYRNLASGAESGWDYSSRWLRTPEDAVKDVYFPLRSLNVVQTVPVDLNAILYANEQSIARFYSLGGNTSACAAWEALATARQDAMYALMWNETYNSYFDYNLTSSSQNVWLPRDDNAVAIETTDVDAPDGLMLALNPAQFYPFWTGAAPDFLRKNPYAVRVAYARIAELLGRKPGAIASSNLITGQQWDEPNVWPPLVYILIRGLLDTPPTFGEQDPSFAYVQDEAVRLAQRYVDSAFCTWRATGGATSALPKLPGAGEGAGVMFEKYADNATNRQGGGGEYEVVEGFGWSNGVLIWIADAFGARLVEPECGEIEAAPPERRGVLGRSAVEVDWWDAKWVKRHVRG